MDGGKSMNDETKTKLPRKRWKRALKWTIGVVLIALLVWFEIAYWTSTNDCQLYSAAPTNPMKAVVYCNYGVPNLKFQEIEKPTPADDQLLVKVRAASVNPLDWHFIEGTPYVMRAMGVGLRKPKDTRLGVDFAGTVEAVGKNVTKFKPGDEVFGGRTGAFAEYVCVRESRAVALKPANITFEQAASVPIAAITALQGVRDKGKVQAGQKVLINGASGGVGTFAVQIAKSYGAEVTGVCSTKNLDMVRSLGANHVIDYTKEDYTQGDQRYDVIYDLVNNRSFAERRRILKPGGICVLAGVGGSGMRKETFFNLAGSLTAALRSKFSKGKFVMFGVDINKKDLGVLRDLTESGKIAPALTKTYPLTETAAAYNYLETGHASGKIAITIE